MIKHQNIKKSIFKNLTERELEIFLMILNGMKTTEIAKSLTLKSNTISTFKKNIFFKVNVSSDFQLFELAHKENVFRLT